MRIMTIFGTRPEAIKLAPVIQQLRSRPDQIQSLICVTGQHREMLDQVLELFQIKANYDLNLMEPNQTPSQVAAKVLVGIDTLLEREKPDWVLVQGDTTTVMATSIAAHHRKVKVGHVEAGLRTYDRNNPFPEEMNRVVTDHISDLHFAPTARARDNLLSEGIPAGKIFVTGNTVTDALHWVIKQPKPPEVQVLLHGLGYGPARQNRSLILVTAHRRENFGEPIQNICKALATLASREDIHIIYPVHRNPNIWETVHELLDGVDRITLVPPVDYLSLVHLMQQSRVILTDSGGIQEEAPSFGIPVLVLRETTERPEAVDAGAAKLVGTDPQEIVAETVKLIDDPGVYEKMSKTINPYGDGHAAQRIVDILTTGKCQEFVAE